MCLNWFCVSVHSLQVLQILRSGVAMGNIVSVSITDTDPFCAFVGMGNGVLEGYVLPFASQLPQWS